MHYEDERPRTNYPIPSVVLPQEWTIIDSDMPAVSIAEGKMQVPLGSHSKDLAMRLHEMAHVKVSPRRKENVKVAKNTIMALSALEDYRINSFIAPPGMFDRTGRYSTGEAEVISDFGRLPEDIRKESMQHFLEDAVQVSKGQHIDPVNRALGMMSAGKPVLTCYEAVKQYERECKLNNLRQMPDRTWDDWYANTNDMDAKVCRDYGLDPRPVYEAIKRVCKDMFPVSDSMKDLAEHLMQQIMNSIDRDTTFNNVVKQSKKWVREIKRLSIREENEREMKYKLAKESNTNTPGFETEQEKKVNEGLEEMIQKALDMNNQLQRRGERGVPRFNKPPDVSLAEALEGIEFEVTSLPLQIYKPSVLSRKKRPEWVGAVPKHIHRLPFDGQMFERKMRGLSGSVLIDNSGSMSLSRDELDLLVRKAPAVTVGAYSGERGGPSGGGRGVLFIMAAHGRMADIEEVYEKAGGLNIVDIHSLEWLAKQRPPRVWVSDGGVTGKNHEHYKCVVDRCVVLCMQHSIIRVPTVKAAIELFTNEAVFSERGRALTRQKLRWQHAE